jgi:hypothetical protein
MVGSVWIGTYVFVGSWIVLSPLVSCWLSVLVDVVTDHYYCKLIFNVLHCLPLVYIVLSVIWSSSFWKGACVVAYRGRWPCVGRGGWFMDVRYLYVTISLLLPISGPGSSVGIVTAYGLDGPRIESR